MDLVRSLVSKQKRRWDGDGYNLDLTYITDSIIAMGFPSEGTEGLFRNPLNEVQRFMKERHGDHVHVYNLCIERSYKAEKFAGRVSVFPFADHNAPKFSMIREFCAHMHEWLRADVKNVAAVHCKAGKGRTGTMICCYLLYCGAMGTAADVLEFYGVRRTYNGHGVTIPSQRRYVQYFAESLQPSFDASRERTTWSLKRIFISHVPLNEHGEVLAEWKPLLGVTRKDKTLLYVGALGANAASCVPSFQCDGLTIQGDVKFELFNGKSTKRLLWFWLNTAFIPPGKKSLTLYKQDLDGICKDKEHKIVPADFSVTVFFEKVSGRARTQRGSKAPPPNPSIISSNHDNAPNSSRSGSLGQPNTSIGARSISPAPNGSPKRQGSFSITSASKSAIRALSPSRKRKAEEKEFFQTSNAASASESTSPTRSHPVNISNRDNENENELGPSSPSSDGGKNESKNSEENSLPHMPPPPSIDPRSFAAAARAHNEAIERPTSPQQADGEKEKPIWTPADYQHRANQGSSSSHGSSISIHEHASHSTQHNASIPETSSQSSKSLQFSSLHQLMGDGSSTSSETSSLPSHSSAGEVNLVVSEFNSSQSLCDICGLVLGSSDTVHVGGKMLHWACATCSVCAEPLANRGSVTIRETTTVDAALICSNCDTFWVRCPHCKRPVQDGNTLRTVPQLDGNKRCDACFCCSICQTSFAPDDDEDVDEDDWKDTFDIIGGAMICKSHSMASRKIFVSKKASTATNDKKNIGEIVSANEKDDINDKSERNASEKRPRSGRIGAVGSGLATMNVSEPIHSQHASSSQISIDSSNIADSNMTSEDGKGQRNDSNEESSSDAANPTPNSSSQSHQDLTSVSGDINDAETKARPARPKREKIEPPSSSLQKLSLRRLRGNAIEMPRCGLCHGLIDVNCESVFVDQLAKSFHVDHFKCGTCSNLILTGELYHVTGDAVHCNDCYSKSSACHKCGQALLGTLIQLAPDVFVHPACCVCDSCSQPIRGSYAEIEDKSFCMKCYENMKPK